MKSTVFIEVFVVEAGGYEESWIRGVFSSLDDAIACANAEPFDESPARWVRVESRLMNQRFDGCYPCVSGKALYERKSDE